MVAIAIAVIDVRSVPQALATIPATVFALSFALNLLGTIIVPSIQTRVALSATRLRLSLAHLIAINLMVRFYVLVLPRPAAVGLRWWAYRSTGDESGGTEAAALMLFERAVQGLVITGAAVVLLAFERQQLPAASGALWGASIALFGVMLCAGVAFVWRPAAAVPRWLLQRRRMPLLLKAPARRLLDAVTAYPGLGPARLLAIVALSLVYFVLFVASFHVLLNAMGVEIGFAAVAWVRALVFVLTLVPVTIAGIGVRELGFVAFLQLYDVPESIALAAAVAALAVQMLIGGMGLGVALWRQWRGGRPGQEVLTTPIPSVPE